MNTNKKTYEIVSGPSKDMLFDACKYAYSRIAKVDINFAIAVGYTTPPGSPGCAYIPMTIDAIRVCSIEHEDGSGESFNLYGFCKANLSGRMDNLEPYGFEAYYNTKTRKGTISFMKS